MKKIIFSLICFISSISIVKGEELTCEKTDYYVKYHDHVINVLKIVNQNNQVLFNIDIDNYKVGGEFTKYPGYRGDSQYSYDNVQKFNTITYYGYNENPSDLNYFITQVYIWQDLFKNDIEICDTKGNIINNYDDLYQSLKEKVQKHYLASPDFLKSYTSNVWESNTLTFEDTPVLEIEDVPGLEIQIINKKVKIKNLDAGDYNLEFKGEYSHDTKRYTDGLNVYWQNEYGPENVKVIVNYKVEGIKVSLIKSIAGIGIANRIGDAYLSSIIEVYLNNELMLTTNKDYFYALPNKEYFIKEIPTNPTIQYIFNRTLKVYDHEVNFYMTNYVVRKDFRLNYLQDDIYEVRLKSTNELYATLNKKITFMRLPYGIYTISNLDKTFSQELEVLEGGSYELLTIGKNEITPPTKEEPDESINDREDDNSKNVIPEENDDNKLEETVPEGNENDKNEEVFPKENEKNEKELLEKEQNLEVNNDLTNLEELANSSDASNNVSNVTNEQGINSFIKEPVVNPQTDDNVINNVILIVLGGFLIILKNNFFKI